MSNYKNDNISYLRSEIALLNIKKLSFLPKIPMFFFKNSIIKHSIAKHFVAELPKHTDINNDPYMLDIA